MPYIDLIILVVVLVFAGKGLWKGFFNEALTFAGFFVALFMATNVSGEVGKVIASFLKVGPGLASVIAFVVIFVLMTILFALAGRAMTSATKALQLSGLNRGLGAAFGGLKGAFICGVLLAVLSEKKIIASLTPQIQQSALAGYLIAGANRLLGWLNL